MNLTALVHDQDYFCGEIGMTGRSVCVKCGSEKLMHNIGVMDHYGDWGRSVRQAQVEFLKNPNAWFFSETIAGKLSTVICGECGYVETYVSNPEELYKAYQQLPNNS